MLQISQNIPLKIRQNKIKKDSKDGMTWLCVPNSIVQMSGAFSVLQLRFLITLIDYLQATIRERENFKRDKRIRIDVNEILSIFKANSDGDVWIDIPLKECGIKAYQYGEFKKTITQMSTIPIEINDKKYDHLFDIETPCLYSKYIRIRISKPIILHFVDTDKGFTRFIKEVAMQARNKYTVRIYLLAASWRERGICRVSYNSLRKWLGIDAKYKDFKDFNRRILKASAKELITTADCWFETEEVIKDSQKKPQSIRFAIVRGRLSSSETERFTLHSNQLYNLLRLHLSFKNEHIEELRPYVNFGTLKPLLDKTIFLLDIVKKNITSITNIPNYCVKALITEVT